MVRKWSEATDGTGNVVRTVLFDYRKAFDLVDHLILTRKVIQLSVPSFVKKWILDFLSNRLSQRVKLSNDCFSEWGGVPSGVPQGTKLGPWLFILMINDLRTPESDCWKYIDDTTISEVVSKVNTSTMQNYTCYAKKVIDKYVDHMNLRKMSLYGSVFSINLSTVTFGLFSCIILLLAYVDYNYF
jgi:hypothetical protein